MNIQIEPGKYVLGVSGGVDSMALLDLLSKKPDVELVVAHFNHGIRSDASKDEKLVKRAAKRYGLQFEVGHGELGVAASEEKARNARYAFLNALRKRHKARAIITAHHQDDLIETALINILRGTGRRGLTSIMDNPGIVRPLINTPKTKIVRYAKYHKLGWHEDSTNKDSKYLRNYIRLQIIPRLKASQKQELVKNIEKVAKNRLELNNIIATLSHTITSNDHVDRSKFATMPTVIANELIIFWLKANGNNQFDEKTIERLNLALKTARPNTKVDVGKNLSLVVGATEAHFSNR
ncbi:MAG: tRNA lysidine(34) synthetase TilS [Candidatus Saccharimonadales bacterium]